MENATNGVAHQGPVPVKRGNQGGKRKAGSEDAIERKRRKAREYYQANKVRLAAQAKKRYRTQAKAGKAVLVIPESDSPPPVPKRPGKVDALICINRSLMFLGNGDTEGAELWGRFAARIIEGKE